MGPHPDLNDSIWDLDAALASGEGLFTYMGMEQKTGEGVIGIHGEDNTIGGNHIPAIGVVIPTGIGMQDGDMEGPGVVGIQDCPNENYISVRSAFGIQTRK